jgi:lysine 2,3-aminomutase
LRNRSGLEEQFVPRWGEDLKFPEELDDPIGDLVHSPQERLVHRYPDRLLVLTTDRCFRYCRFCFRRHWTGRGLARFTEEDRQRLETYLVQHSEVREVILSGGDALTLPDEDLFPLLSLIRSLGRMVRLSTRTASLAPQRVTHELLERLEALGGIWWIHHVNHPDELHQGFQQTVKKLFQAGVAQVSQTVLLSKLNDQPTILLNLFEQLALLGIKPYYLFYTDLASGTRSWRTSLDRALEIWQEVKLKASRLVLPTFAVDLPGGKGKVEVEASLLSSDERGWTFRAPDGSLVLYPRSDDLSKERST